MAETVELFAYVADGEDSICAIEIGVGWLPLVFAKREKVEIFRDAVQGVATCTGQTIRLIRFSRSQVVETLEPQRQ
jgi:hypothetical protein